MKLNKKLNSAKPETNTEMEKDASTSKKGGCKCGSASEVDEMDVIISE